MNVNASECHEHLQQAISYLAYYDKAINGVKPEEGYDMYYVRKGSGYYGSIYKDIAAIENITKNLRKSVKKMRDRCDGRVK